MSNNSVIEALAVSLASSYVLYIKTQNYHWNVTGPNFSSLHALFEQQYTDMQTAIDDLAERIKALGGYAPGSLGEFLELSTVNDKVVQGNSNDMLHDLIAANKALISTLEAIQNASIHYGDAVSEGMAIDRVTVHEKALWMLSASLS